MKMCIGACMLDGKGALSQNPRDVYEKLSGVAEELE